jgi:hypothetical protein
MISIFIVLYVIGVYITIQVGLKFFLGNYQFRGKRYLFNPETLHELAKKASNEGKTKEEMFKIIVDELKQKHPLHIWEEKPLKWHWFNAGGWVSYISAVSYIYIL